LYNPANFCQKTFLQPPAQRDDLIKKLQKRMNEQDEIVAEYTRRPTGWIEIPSGDGWQRWMKRHVKRDQSTAGALLFGRWIWQGGCWLDAPGARMPGGCVPQKDEAASKRDAL
jgi:hypothetical protein